MRMTLDHQLLVLGVVSTQDGVSETHLVKNGNSVSVIPANDIRDVPPIRQLDLSKVLFKHMERSRIRPSVVILAGEHRHSVLSHALVVDNAVLVNRDAKGIIFSVNVESDEATGATDNLLHGAWNVLDKNPLAVSDGAKFTAAGLVVHDNQSSIVGDVKLGNISEIEDSHRPFTGIQGRRQIVVDRLISIDNNLRLIIVFTGCGSVVARTPHRLVEHQVARLSLVSVGITNRENLAIVGDGRTVRVPTRNIDIGVARGKIQLPLSRRTPANDVTVNDASRVSVAYADPLKAEIVIDA